MAEPNEPASEDTLAARIAEAINDDYEARYPPERSVGPQATPEACRSLAQWVLLRDPSGERRGSLVSLLATAASVNFRRVWHYGLTAPADAGSDAVLPVTYDWAVDQAAARAAREAEADQARYPYLLAALRGQPVAQAFAVSVRAGRPGRQVAETWLQAAASSPAGDEFVTLTRAESPSETARQMIERMDDTITQATSRLASLFEARLDELPPPEDESRMGIGRLRDSTARARNRMEIVQDLAGWQREPGPRSPRGSRTTTLSGSTVRDELRSPAPPGPGSLVRAPWHAAAAGGEVYDVEFFTFFACYVRWWLDVPATTIREAAVTQVFLIGLSARGAFAHGPVVGVVASRPHTAFPAFLSQDADLIGLLNAAVLTGDQDPNALRDRTLEILMGRDFDTHQPRG